MSTWWLTVAACGRAPNRATNSPLPEPSEATEDRGDTPRVVPARRALGRVRFTATAVVQGGPAPSFPAGGGSRTGGLQLRVAVAATNEGQRPVILKYSQCSLIVLVYRGSQSPALASGGTAASAIPRVVGAEPTPSPVWRGVGGGEAWWRAEERWQVGCTELEGRATLSPGQTFRAPDLATAIPTVAILGDSLPGGEYTAIVRMRIDDLTREGRGGAADTARISPAADSTGWVWAGRVSIPRAP